MTQLIKMVTLKFSMMNFCPGTIRTANQKIFAPASSNDGYLSVTDREVRSKKKDNVIRAERSRVLGKNFKTFKAIMLGSSNVGKTNLVSSFRQWL